MPTENLPPELHFALSDTYENTRGAVMPRQLKSGKFQARFWDRDAQRHVSLGTFATEKEAQQAEWKFEAGIEDPKPEAPKPVIRGRQEFGQYALEVLQARKHILKPGTYHNHLWALNTHLKRFHKIALADITESAVIRWWNDMENNPHARRHAYGTMSMVFKRAVRQKLVTFSPCTVEGASRDVSKKRPTFHAADVRMLMMLTDDDQMIASLWLLLGTGIRVGELLALDWEKVNLEESTITVDRHLTVYRLEEGTKSHPDGHRVLAMPQEATEAILRLFKHRKPLPSDPVFLNARETRLSYHRWNARFVELKRAIGLDNLHAHDLRHVHLSEFSKRGTLAETMARAGHTDHRSALRYQHVDPARQKEIVSQMQF